MTLSRLLTSVYVSALSVAACFGEGRGGVIFGRITTSDGQPAEYANIVLKGTSYSAHGRSVSGLEKRGSLPGGFSVSALSGYG